MILGKFGGFRTERLGILDLKDWQNLYFVQVSSSQNLPVASEQWSKINQPYDVIVGISLCRLKPLLANTSILQTWQLGLARLYEKNGHPPRKSQCDMSWEPSDQVQPKVTSRKSSVASDSMPKSEAISSRILSRGGGVNRLYPFYPFLLLLYYSCVVIMSHYESRPQAVVHHGLSICHKQALFENPPRSHF